MTQKITIEFPPIDAEKGLAIKDRLQRQDILGDFGPGRSLMQTLLGKKAPQMQFCHIIDDRWFEMNWNGEGDYVPLTKSGKENLDTAVQEIYNNAGGPITVLCSRDKQRARGQKEMNIFEFNAILETDGLPNRTLVILDRRIIDRPTHENQVDESSADD